MREFSELCDSLKSFRIPQAKRIGHEKRLFIEHLKRGSQLLCFHSQRQNWQSVSALILQLWRRIQLSFKITVFNRNTNYNIASRATQSNSLYPSVLKIPIVPADGLSKSLRQNFFFARAAIVSAGKMLYFATELKNDCACHQFARKNWGW